MSTSERAPPWRRWELIRGAYQLARPGALRDLRWRWAATAASMNAVVSKPRFVAVTGSLLGLVSIEQHKGQRLETLLGELFFAFAGQRTVADLRELVVGLFILQCANSNIASEEVLEWLFQIYDLENKGWLSTSELSSLIWSLASTPRTVQYLADLLQNLDHTTHLQWRLLDLQALLTEELFGICRYDALSSYDRASIKLQTEIEHVRHCAIRAQNLRKRIIINQISKSWLRQRLLAWKRVGDNKKVSRQALLRARIYFQHKWRANVLQKLQHRALAATLKGKANEIAFHHVRRKSLRHVITRWKAFHKFQAIKKEMRMRVLMPKYEHGLKKLQKVLKAAEVRKAHLQKEEFFWTWQRLWRKHSLESIKIKREMS